MLSPTTNLQHVNLRLVMSPTDAKAAAAQSVRKRQLKPAKQRPRPHLRTASSPKHLTNTALPSQGHAGTHRFTSPSRAHTYTQPKHGKRVSSSCPPSPSRNTSRPSLPSPFFLRNHFPGPRNANDVHSSTLSSTRANRFRPLDRWSILIGLIVVVAASGAAWVFSPKGETQTYVATLSFSHTFNVIVVGHGARG